MKTQEILSITALSALGLCLLCGLAKMAIKSSEAKKGCDQACGMLVFVAVVLIGVGQLLGKNDGYKYHKRHKDSTDGVWCEETDNPEERGVACCSYGKGQTLEKCMKECGCSKEKSDNNDHLCCEENDQILCGSLYDSTCPV